MAIKIERGPSMIDYGRAVAQASERTYAAERQKDYANYLAGIQKANQDYKLGAAKLGIEGKEQGEYSAYRNRQLDWNIAAESERMKLQREVAAKNYALNWWNAGANMLGANVGAMQAHGSLYG